MFYTKPYLCSYCITFRCHSKCVFCGLWRDKSLKDIQDAELDDVKKNLIALKKLGVKMIDFTGGEPLLHENLPEILQFSKKLGFFTKLSTSGVNYLNRAEEIKNLASRIYFSIETFSKEEYKDIRGIDAYEQIIEGLKYAKQLKENVYIVSTISNDNIHNLPALANFCKQNKINAVIHPCFSYFGNEGLNKKYIKEMTRYFLHSDIRPNLPQLKFYYDGGNNPQKTRCKAGSSIFEIEPNNTIPVPCFSKRLKNIKINNNLFEIYQSDQWKQSFQDAGKYDFCEHCSIDCYFGLSFLDRIDEYPFRQILTGFRQFIESVKGVG